MPSRFRGAGPGKTAWRNHTEARMVHLIDCKAPRTSCDPLAVQPTRSVTALAPALLGATALALVMTFGAQAQQTEQPTEQQIGQQIGQQDGQQSDQQIGTQPSDTGTASSMQQPGASPSPSGDTASAPTGAAEGAPAIQQAVAMPGQIVEQSEQTYGVADLIGTDVASPDGEYVGEVIDVLLTEDNQVAGVVVSIGGFLGFGDKEIAFEIDRVRMAKSPDGEQRLVMDFTREELEQAPEFVSLAAQRVAAEEAEWRRQREQAQQNAGQPGQQGGVQPASQ